MDTTLRRPTRADVARRAGVSETVVSYVVNNNRYVDRTKRERVERAIAELGYQPNLTARMLKGKKSHHIVFIADQIANEHFSLLLAEMERHAYAFGYLLSLCATRDTPEFVNEIIRRQYDGIVISSTSFPEERIRQFLDARIPVVLLGNRGYRGLDEAGRIDTGLYDGARACVAHLAACGRRGILYVDRFSRSGHFSTMDDMRLRGFLEQAAQAGVRHGVVTGCADEEAVAAAVRERLGEYDAVFGRNDNLACIAMRAARELRLRVPQDVAVVGFDNSRLGRFTTPTLTTVEMQRTEIGRAAVEMLHTMIEGGGTPPPVRFPARLIARESTSNQERGRRNWRAIC